MLHSLKICLPQRTRQKKTMDGPEAEIPPFFICPISLEIMKDPVTLSTGMTYERESIHKWIFIYNQKTCPITHQPIAPDESLTPNCTLLRIIQQWYTNILPSSVSIPASSITAKPSFHPSILAKLVDEVKKSESRMDSLRKIKSLIQENDGNRRCMEEAGLSSVIASLIIEMHSQEASTHHKYRSKVVEEAMGILCLLNPCQDVLKKVGEEGDGKIIELFAVILQQGSYQARIYSALLLKSIFKAVDERYKSRLQPEFFAGTVEILKDQNSNRATLAILSILIEVIPYGSNRINAVDAGVVAILVELVAETNERRSSELMLGVLEILCARAEGRSAFGAHPVAVAAVVGKILTISQVASELAVKILLDVCSFCVKGGVVQEMMEVGGVGRLFTAVQADCSKKTKKMAKEILGLHFRVWNKSPCFARYMLP